MPVITVFGAFGHINVAALALTPNGAWQAAEWKKALAVALQDAVLAIKDLGHLTRADVAVYLPDGVASSELTFIDVHVLFDASHRTRALRLTLAEALHAAALATYKAISPGRERFEVEVAVRPPFDRLNDVYLP